MKKLATITSIAVLLLISSGFAFAADEGGGNVGGLIAIGAGIAIAGAAFGAALGTRESSSRGNGVNWSQP